MRLMEWALRTRAYSPKVVMFQQLAPAIANDGKCEAFVHLGGDNIYCTVDELRNAVKQPPSNFRGDE
ncbi:UDP-glucose:glycoprotein glucosyltransferase 2 [Orchesella cincta]|uniref:UDP-glucose:glycoprotein glucosyltransferase 2 n=1 Tax=Orchesella cincta TaxID=48709 RepID=A0A1D2N199_ORCCI|nr:UDP-glucose:glycoprotein glucosyltransferase 2 [Orchesella cincta]